MSWPKAASCKEGGTWTTSAAAGEHSVHTVTATSTVAPGVHSIEIDYFQVSIKTRRCALTLSLRRSGMLAGRICQLRADDESGSPLAPAARLVMMPLSQCPLSDAAFLLKQPYSRFSQGRCATRDVYTATSTSGPASACPS